MGLSDFTDTAFPAVTRDRDEALLWGVSPMSRSAGIQRTAAIVGALKGTKMTAKILRLPVAHRPPAPDPSSLFSATTPFMSRCPTCSEPRSQVGYSPWGLFRRLNDHRPIEAFCVTCNQFWPITAQERVQLAEELEHLRLI